MPPVKGLGFTLGIRVEGGAVATNAAADDDHVVVVVHAHGRRGRLRRAGAQWEPLPRWGERGGGREACDQRLWQSRAWLKVRTPE